MCFFKWGSCEKATAVAEHSFIGHLNLRRKKSFSDKLRNNFLYKLTVSLLRLVASEKVEIKSCGNYYSRLKNNCECFQVGKTLRRPENRPLIATCLRCYQLPTQSFTIADNDSVTCLYVFGCGALKPMSVRMLEDKLRMRCVRTFSIESLMQTNFDSDTVSRPNEFFGARWVEIVVKTERRMSNIPGWKLN